MNPRLAAFLLVLSVPVAVHAEERVAGTIVAVQGDLLVVELGEEPGVGPGTVMQAFRQLPAARGTAAYRDAGVWFEVAELTVVQVADGVAIARRTGDPGEPVPADLDETGAPPEEVWVGDRVRTTGAVALRPVEVRVTFDRADLFGEADFDLPEPGRAHLAGWLRGLRSMDLPITVEVHGRFQELGQEPVDMGRALSADQDAPFGPAPGESVIPVDGLHGVDLLPSRPPSGDEVIVVDAVRPDGTVDAWRYLDPVTLAHRRGRRVAEALAVHLDLPPEAVTVRVVPRGISASYPSAAGYDRPGDQVRILSGGIDWSPPDPFPRPAAPSAAEPSVDPEDPSPRKRRLLERPAEVSSRTLTPRVPAARRN
jgi:hypothetical protein